MPGGRPRKPRAQHALEGTLRPDRHGAAPEAAAPCGVPQPPPELQGEALCCWNHTLPLLVARGVVTELDTEALVIYCQWVGRYRRWSAALDAMDAADGRANQLTVRLGITTDKVRQYGAAFGLTPVDREKVRAAPQAGGPQTPVAARDRSKK